MYCNKKISFGLCILAFSLILTGFINTKASTKSNIESTKTNINHIKFNIPKYNFIGNVVKDASVVEYKDFRIVQSYYLKSNKQVLTYDQVAKEFKKLPKTLAGNVKEIQLVDYRNALDKYIEEKFKMKDFRSYAIGVDEKICFYANNQYTNRYNKTLFEILIHESAHNLDVAVSSEERKLSNSTEWYKIVQKDFKFKNNKLYAKDYGRYCSAYGLESKSSTEDFAEAVVSYVTNKEQFTKEYPNRSKKINELLN